MFLVKTKYKEQQGAEKDKRGRRNNVMNTGLRELEVKE